MYLKMQTTLASMPRCGALRLYTYLVRMLETVVALSACVGTLTRGH